MTEQQLKDAKEQKRQGQTLRRKPSNIRRPTTGAQRTPLTTIDSTEDDAVEEEAAGAPAEPEAQPASSEEETLRADEDSNSGEPDEDDGDLSDAESFTLKDRQDAINVTHPFGIRIWKPALYKKGRSVQRNAEADIHSNPGLFVSRWLLLFNGAWTLIFGWWLALLVTALVSASSGLLACTQRLGISLHHSVLRPPIWRTATRHPPLARAVSSRLVRDKAAPTAPLRQ